MNARSILFSFQGRVNRQIWWASFVFGTFIIAVSSFLDLCILGKGHFSCLTLIAIAIIGWPMLAIQVKRFHDRNKSGWWSLVGLVPYVGTLWIIIELGFFGPVEEGNRFNG